MINKRFLVYHDEIGRDDLFAVYTARLDSLQQGNFIGPGLTDLRISVFEIVGYRGKRDSWCRVDGSSEQEVKCTRRCCRWKEEHLFVIYFTYLHAE